MTDRRKEIEICLYAPVIKLDDATFKKDIHHAETAMISYIRTKAKIAMFLKHREVSVEVFSCP